MTIEEAVRILDPETTREALRPYAYDPERRIQIVEEACRVAVRALRDMKTADHFRDPTKMMPLTLEQLCKAPHGKVKDSTLKSICDRANEISKADG